MLLTTSQLREISDRLGFTLLAVLTRETAETLLNQQLDHLADWQAAGRAGEMHYMLRPPKLFAELGEFLPGVRTLISFFVPYQQHLSPTGKQLQPAPAGYGRVARYAWGKDYHRLLKKRLLSLVKEIALVAGRSPAYRVFSDSVPMLERALANFSPQGFVGRNSMFISPGVGSFGFLAEILLDVDIDGAEQTKPISEKNPGSSCGSCRRCLDTCPTRALVADGVLDARRCISYLTIEKRGVLDEWEQQAVGDWLFGCDICQDVCPFNHPNTEPGTIHEFGPTYGAGPYIELSGLLKIRNKAEFENLYAGSPLMRAGREGMLRNACCVLANSRHFSALSQLIEVREFDESETIRVQANRALRAMLAVAEGLDRRRILTALSKEADSPQICG